MTIEVEDHLFVVATHSFAGSEAVPWRAAHAAVDWIMGMLRRPDLEDGRNWQPINYSRTWAIPPREGGDRRRLIGLTRVTSAEELADQLEDLGVQVEELPGEGGVVEAQRFAWPVFLRMNLALPEADRRVLAGLPLAPLAGLQTVKFNVGGLAQVRDIVRTSPVVAVYREPCLMPPVTPGVPNLLVAAAVVGADGVPYLVWGETLDALPAALAAADRVVIGDDEELAGQLGAKTCQLRWVRPLGRMTLTATAVAAVQLLAEYHRQVRVRTDPWSVFSDPDPL